MTYLRRWPRGTPPLPIIGKRRPTIPKDARFFVWHRDGGRCTNCQEHEQLEFDHVIPLAIGGSNRADNIQLLCATCNRRKSSSLFDGGS